MAPPSRRAAKKPAAVDVDPRSSFPPESFERELQALAAKAREEAGAARFARQAAVYAQALALLTLAAASSTVSELALSPVYGAIPSSIWHDPLFLAACFVGWSANVRLARALPVRPHLLLPLAAAYVPPLQCLLFRLSGVLTAAWGPLLTELPTLFPLLVLSVACTADRLDQADLGRLRSVLPGWMADAAPGMASYAYLRASQALCARWIRASVGRSRLLTRVGLQGVLAALYAALAPSRLLLLAAPAALHTALLNPHAPTPLGTSALNGTLQARGWALLDRRESLTGYVSVVESLQDGFRVLRCDHSLLGGEWVKFRDGPLAGNPVAEPIYGVFTMLEAVRLVHVPEPVPDQEARALVIGMGIGTTPAALVAHGIDTTVVEIDPAVRDFALRYFRLPRNHTGVLADAVSYAQTLADGGAARFDYIVHDVFTGGAEPIELFTLEFLQNLDALLRPGGVIAINYAGDLTLPPPRIILRTIRAVFPRCRVFREHPRDDEAVAREGRDFTNMVVFCTKAAAAAAAQDGRATLSFREPTPADLLGSPSRQAFLVPKHEVRDADLLGEGPGGGGDDGSLLRKNETAKLARWHRQSALGHWAIMRVVLPKVVWETW